VQASTTTAIAESANGKLKRRHVENPLWSVEFLLSSKFIG
jgi:hypothetical protein